MGKLIRTLPVLLLLVSNAGAANLALDFTTPTIDFTNNTWSLGFEFNLLEAVTVTALGFYDDQKNDLTERHEVGIFDTGGTLLVSGLVAPGATLNSWFRMVDVPDTVLSAGNGYRIAATTGGENYTWSPTGLILDPRVQFVSDRFTLSTSLVFPETSQGGGLEGWFGPTFEVDDAAVPEPGSMFLASIGLAALAAVRRYRR